MDVITYYEKNYKGKKFTLPNSSEKKKFKLGDMHGSLIQVSWKGKSAFTNRESAFYSISDVLSNFEQGIWKILTQ